MLARKQGSRAGQSTGKSPPTDSSATQQSIITKKNIDKLIKALESTRAEEYSCQETFALLDEFVELAADKKDAAALMPLVQHHIDTCPDCQEHFEILLRILEGETAA